MRQIGRRSAEAPVYKQAEERGGGQGYPSREQKARSRKEVTETAQPRSGGDKITSPTPRVTSVPSSESPPLHAHLICLRAEST
jgi:hypothetical protein